MLIDDVTKDQLEGLLRLNVIGPFLVSKVYMTVFTVFVAGSPCDPVAQWSEYLHILRAVLSWSARFG